jgi:hypothetical protein
MITKSPAESLVYLPADDSIIELSLMMSRRQFEALEERARADGTSVAQFLRKLVQDATEEMPAL